MKLTQQQARRFILNKQALMGAQRFHGVDGVTAFCRQAGCIQFDPVDACGRNADLTLQSRVKDYKKDMLSSALYERRELIDYWDKNMAIIPASDWPFFARTRERFKSMDMRSQSEINVRAETVKQFLREKGPCFSDDLNMPEKIDWYWSATTAARAVLEALYFRGELGIHHKRGTQKCYDLCENLLGPGLLHAPDPYPDDAAHQKERVKRRIGAVGMLWNKPSDAFLGIEDLKAPERGRAFETLLAEGLILPVTVEDVRGTLYMLKSDEHYLEMADDRPRTEFIAPLDPMMWDRKLIAALFGFDYKWEIYTPVTQRKYGHYVLPILQGDCFTGRIELIAAYKERVLRVKNIWPEKGQKCDKRAVKRRVKAFAAFADAKDIVYET